MEGGLAFGDGLRVPAKARREFEVPEMGRQVDQFLA